MKLTNHANKLETNAEFTSQDFGIGDASVVIEILRNRLYSHPIRTLVQEYICNGRDAEREAGNNGKIEITIPNRLNPVFKVRDYGVGIDPDRMGNIFVKYGASTKRDTNTQTGGFGIGAKSAWSYTDSFTIITYVDGIQRSYIAHTGVNNNGRLDHFDTCKTDKPNGTEIQVPVKPNDLDTFKNAVFRCIYFWDSGYKLHGITEVDYPKKNKTIKIMDGLEITQEYLPNYINNSYRKEPIAIIDGIPYPIKVNNDALDQVNNLLKGQLLFFINNGVLEVSASRENIADGKASQDAITKLSDNYYTAISKYLKNRFSSAKDIRNYIDIYNELKNSIKTDKFSQFKGYSIDRYGNQLINESFKELLLYTCIFGKNNTIKKREHFKEYKWKVNTGVPIDSIDNIYFTDGTESRIKENNRLRTLFAQYPNKTVYLLAKNENTKEYNQVIKDLKVKDLKSLDLTEKPKVHTVKVKRDKKEFCVREITRYNRKTPVYLTLDTNKDKWLYIPMEKNDLVGFQTWQVQDLANYFERKGYRLCGLSKQSIEHVRNDGRFTLLIKWLDAYKPTKDDLNSVKHKFATERSLVDRIKKMTGIKDKFLLQVIKEYNELNSNKLPDIINDKIGNHKEVIEFRKLSVTFKTIMNKTYPLVAETNKFKKGIDSELEFYINCKYRLNKQLAKQGV